MYNGVNPRSDASPNGMRETALIACSAARWRREPLETLVLQPTTGMRHRPIDRLSNGSGHFLSTLSSVIDNRWRLLHDSHGLLITLPQPMVTAAWASWPLPCQTSTIPKLSTWPALRAGVACWASDCENPLEARH